MPITLHQISIETYTNALTLLKSLLQKAQSHVSAASLPTARLADDMYTLTGQVQTASNIVKAGIYRLLPELGENPVWADDEKTLDDLIARCDKTLALLERATPEMVNGREDGPSETRLGNGTVIRGDVKAYGILRKEGVPLGKVDYLTHFAAGLEVRPPVAN
ncbi:hypothetical protein OQA88_8100 [Cercophora sp. LCS_1]